MQKIIGQIAEELNVKPQQVGAAVELLDGGATVPFVARYRKEATGGLDDTQLRQLDERLTYLRELEDRRGSVLKAIDEQGKLTDVLRLAIANAPTKQELEDIYLPFKQKRRTKGQIAKEFGIEPLADKLFADPTLDPHKEAEAFCKPATTLDDGKLGPDFSTTFAVLDGVRDILSERWAEDPVLVQKLREWLWEEGLLRSKKVESKNENDPEVAKFRDYFDYDEPIGRVPSHRALAVFRGRALEILEAKLVQPIEPEPGQPSLAEGKIALHLGWSHAKRTADDLIRKCVAWTWRVKLSLSTERDLFSRLREDAEKVAIKVFGDNLRDLLLAAPAGQRTVIGLDPGLRTDIVYTFIHRLGLFRVALFFTLEPVWDLLFGKLHVWGLPSFQLDGLWPGVTDKPWVSFLLYLLVFDVLDYWIHRGQHAWGWWWKLHALHHSQRQMTMWSDNRNHLLDDVVRDSIIVVVAQLIGVGPAQFVLLVALTQLSESFHHANIRIWFGRWGERLWISPRFHRRHHTIGIGHETKAPVRNQKAHGNNFGVLLPWWDMLWGTANFDVRWDPTGVRDQVQPNEKGELRDYGRTFWVQQWKGVLRLLGKA